MKNLILLLFVLVAVGCSDPNQGVVTGTVLVDGTPAPTGAISFYPLDKKSKVTGGVINNGAYSVEVPVGSVRVEIRVSKVVGQQRLYDTPDSKVQPVMQEVLPPQYHDRSELILDVKAGKNAKDYDLASMDNPK